MNGGAIALGHPIGASGARLLMTLVFALRERQLNRGIACLCLGEKKRLRWRSKSNEIREEVMKD